MNSSIVVKTIYADGGTLGLKFYRREDGHFSFYEIKLYEIPFVGNQWRHRVGGWRGGIYETLEIAEREAYTMVPWLLSETSNGDIPPCPPSLTVSGPRP